MAIAEDLTSHLPAGGAGVVRAVTAQITVLDGTARAVLAHDDFAPDHVLVADGEIAAVIDWERAGRADPARDVAWWYLYDPYVGGGARHMRPGATPR